jgi:hypothetical protein
VESPWLVRVSLSANWPRVSVNRERKEMIRPLSHGAPCLPHPMKRTPIQHMRLSWRNPRTLDQTTLADVSTDE